ncbi:unnamed protein product [Dovyalis caffra]|uniref:Uncharacterized protein n=1 Tax=Dovyalis caffra TaxID=77055 RepID=A0AAV1RHM9_9ROSI|nr:unnamed protein product [Dovyalis caffra]
MTSTDLQDRNWGPYGQGGIGDASGMETQFERLLSRTDTLTDKQVAECFINRLKDDLRADVKIRNPQTLTTATGLAHAYKNKAQKVCQTPHSTSSPLGCSSPQWSSTSTGGSKGTSPEHSLTVQSCKLFLIKADDESSFIEVMEEDNQHYR